MTKRPWRSKGKQSNIKPATAPGQCVSVDQLESGHPRLVAQLKGKLTKRRYRAATVFVDHFSGYTYVHLQHNLTGDETVWAKEAFEAHLNKSRIKVRHCHADNGRFANNKFLHHVQEGKQTISYCGINAHHQNGIAEKHIRDLQDQTRKQILHAQARWPRAVDIAL
eukprot:11618352-Ditylum_brightwellii.AAC.3